MACEKEVVTKRDKLTDKNTGKEKKTFFQEVRGMIAGLLSDFWEWLKPHPDDHWLLQLLKGIAKLPLVILLITCSPILVVILLLVFLIAL